MTSPPDYTIEAARQVALQSPCAKSKRGVVLFNPETAERLTKHLHPSHLVDSSVAIVSRGFNGQPDGFPCSGDASCREHCAKLCLHAEQRAIYAAGALDDVRDLELVHVKVVDGAVVPGGGPSCWQCSRLVVEVGLRGVWLYETVMPDREPGLGRVAGGWSTPSSSWRFYTATAFHVATMKACRIGASA